MTSALYILVQVVWGLPQTIAGGVAFLAYRKRPHFAYHGAIVTVWEQPVGLSLGPFVFVNSRYGVTGKGASPVERYGIDEKLLVHEYGHTVQSLILGPLYLVVIGLPSFVWMKARPLSRWRRRSGTSYYVFYPERWANRLGERVLKRPSMGMAHVD